MRINNLYPEEYKNNPNRLHSDGTECLEGFQQVPIHYKPCCELFNAHTKNCVVDIRYEWWDHNKMWFIRLPAIYDSSGIVIKYCPHCGKKLVKT